MANFNSNMNIEELKKVFELLNRKDVYRTDSGFSSDKDTIKKVFSCTKLSVGNSIKYDILARLTLIDSMYSTQMNRRYYALEELADELEKLANGNLANLNTLFLNFAAKPDKSTKLAELFSKHYGIGKDGNEKGIAISLISKYAYFETGFKFPIYDTIACEMYPLVWNFCGFAKKAMPKIKYQENKNSDKSSSDESGCEIDERGCEIMVAYVEAINLLIDKLNKLFGSNYVTYDLLDRFLWFVGKIRRGNLSLILTRDEYLQTLKIYPPTTITTISKNGKELNKTEYFSISDIDINKLPYLNNNVLLRMFFEFAKHFGPKK